MGVADLRDAFNAVSEPRFTCTKALMNYDRSHDAESQILTFSGMGADGNSFEVKSGRLRGNANLITAAAESAQQLLDRPVS